MATTFAREILLTQQALVLVHTLATPDAGLFGTSKTIPIPPISVVLSQDVEQVCDLLGLDKKWWKAMEAKGDHDGPTAEEFYRFLLGVEGGLIRKAWEKVFELNTVKELAVIDSSSAIPLLDIVPRNAPRSKPMNAKQRSKISLPSYQKLLQWLQVHGGAFFEPSTP